jgi:hypothetical protein
MISDKVVCQSTPPTLVICLLFAALGGGCAKSHLPSGNPESGRLTVIAKAGAEANGAGTQNMTRPQPDPVLNPDQPDILRTVRTHAEGMRDGNAVKFRDTFYAPDEGRRAFAAAFARYVATSVSLAKAADHAYGAGAGERVATVEAFVMPYLGSYGAEMVKNLDSNQVDVNLNVKGNGTAAQFAEVRIDPPGWVGLRRADDRAWKVVLPGDWPDEPQQLGRDSKPEDQAKGFAAIADAFDDTAREVKTGKYKTAADVSQSLLNRLIIVGREAKALPER